MNRAVYAFLPTLLALSACTPGHPATDIPGKPSDLLVTLMAAPDVRPLAMSLGGGDAAWITWTEPGRGVMDLYAAQRSGEGFGEPVFLTSDSVWSSASFIPAVAGLGGTGAVALYFGQGANHQTDLFAVDTHGSRTVVDKGIGTQEGRIALIHAPDGKVAAFWKRHVAEPGSPGRPGVDFAELNGGTFETPRSILPSTTVCDPGPLAAAAGAEAMVVSWRSIYFDSVQRYFVSGIEGGVILIRNFERKPFSRDEWQVPRCPDDGPSASGAGHSLFLVSYTGDHEPRVRYQTSTDNGRQFSGPNRVDAGHPVGKVAIGALDEKSAVVVWQEAGSLLARDVSVDGDIGSVIPVATVSSLREAPVMVRDGDHLLLGWIDAGTLKLATIRRKP